jgi:hypothetical protein
VNASHFILSFNEQFKPPSCCLRGPLSHKKLSYSPQKITHSSLGDYHVACSHATIIKLWFHADLLPADTAVKPTTCHAAM